MWRRCGLFLAALAAAALMALALDPRAQALLVFLWWADWPPADWDAPLLPFPCISKSVCAWDAAEGAWLPPRPRGLDLNGLMLAPFEGVRVRNASAFRVATRRPDGAQLGVWVMHGPTPGEGGRRDVAIYAHGNGGNRALAHRVKLYEQARVEAARSSGGVARSRARCSAAPECRLRRAPAATQLLHDEASRIDTVVAFDYSGFAESGRGESAWDISEARVIDDMLTVDAWVKKALQPRTIIWWGHSLGTGVALGALERLADGAKISDASSLPAALVLEAPFTSVVDVAALQWGPLARLLSHSFHSLPRAARRLCPTLVIHGEYDSVVPIDQGRAVAMAAGGTFASFASGHNDIVLRKHQFARVVNEFLDESVFARNSSDCSSSS
ncbi:hypothetical protein AB1Y20_015548 [Prymnesium parvum]|uniref:Serine aminopeptidase S33 domain-containing protein n=1 Tax=Prymnesium parvum TaxID=97485 RepID=A0AB34K0V6_PRYPA